MYQHLSKHKHFKIFSQNLASSNVSTELQREQVSSDLAILTSNSSGLSANDVQDSLATVERIVSKGELKKKVK